MKNAFSQIVHTFITLCAGAVLFSASAFAGGVAIDRSKDVTQVATAPVPPPCTWTGFYLGLHGGYGWGNSKTTSPDTGFGLDDPQSVSFDTDGGIFGGQLGYNWQFNNWFVLGLEASGGWLGLSGREFNFRSPPDNFASADYNWYALVTPRIGISFWNNRLLFYAKGGVAFVDLENRAGDLDGRKIDPRENSTISDTEVGWTVGGGLEYALTCHWSVAVEYDYIGGIDRSSSNFNSNFSITQHYDHNNDANLVTARVSYRF